MYCACVRQAHSASIIFTGLLDGGRNYCNLHDLLTCELLCVNTFVC